MSRESQTKFQLWVETDDLERWKEAFGARNLSRSIRDATNRAAADVSSNTRIVGNTSVPVERTSVSSKVASRKFDPSCTNRQYHWKGACKYCGGS